MAVRRKDGGSRVQGVIWGECGTVSFYYQVQTGGHEQPANELRAVMENMLKHVKKALVNRGRCFCQVGDRSVTQNVPARKVVDCVTGRLTLLATSSQ